MAITKLKLTKTKELDGSTCFKFYIDGSLDKCFIKANESIAEKEAKNHFKTCLENLQQGLPVTTVIKEIEISL